MQKPRSIEKRKTTAGIGSLGLLILGFVHGEAWIIATVILLGPFWSYVILAIIVTVLVNTIIFVLESKAKVHCIERLRERSTQRQACLSPIFQKVFRVGKTTGILTSGAIVGAIPTAFLIHALGYRRPSNYLLATLVGFIFVAVWVSFYSGIMASLQRIIAQI